MYRINNKNVVIVYRGSRFRKVAKDAKRLLKDKRIVVYPAPEGFQTGLSNIKHFVEEDDHVLFTEGRFFDGCEASNVIFLCDSFSGIRNHLLRAVSNLICVQIQDDNSPISYTGMKENDRFHDPKRYRRRNALANEEVDDNIESLSDEGM